MTPTPIDWPRKTPERMVQDSLHDPENMRDFLSSATPGLAANFNYAAMRPLKLTFWGEDWREREADLLFELPYLSDKGATSTLVCLLMEHQTNAERVTPLRTFIVSGNFWDRCWRTWAESEAPRGSLMLPPIIPIVLHTGEHPWGSTTSIRDLLAGPDELKQWVPDWGPHFWSLADRSVNDLLAGGAWMQFMAVMRVQKADAAEFERVFKEAVRHLAALRQTNQVRWYELFRIVFGFSLFRRTAPNHSRLREIALASVPPDHIEEVSSMSMTGFESLIFEGKLRMARQDLRDILEDKFGTLPEELIRRIETQTDLDRLRAVHKQAWRLQSLDDLKL